MKLTTRFTLQSRGAGLSDLAPYTRVYRSCAGLSPLLELFSKRLTPVPPLEMGLKSTGAARVSHPCSSSFPRGLLLCPRWRWVLRLQELRGSLTLARALFQEAYSCAPVGDGS